MSHSLGHRAIRFVISKDNRLWSDNTHWTLAYILEKGVDALVLDVLCILLILENHIL